MAREITKLVLKATLVTLLSIVSLVLVLLMLLSFTAPAAMARLTRDLGMYQQSAWYSSLQYAEGNGDISNIEMSMNCCALVGDEEGVIKYGVQFIEDQRFEAHCAQREAEEAGKYDELYTQYVYGRIGLAYYRTQQKQAALDLALSVNINTFDEYNAVTDLVNEVILKQDKVFGAEILTKLSVLRNTGSVSDAQYLDATIQNLTVFTS